MNLIDLVVLQVLGEPQKKYGKWFVEVKCEAYGRVSFSEIMCDTYEQAKAVKRGHIFQA